MYNHKKIEKKWQAKWEKDGAHKAEDFSDKPKYYCLDMFPYPSGEGLHVGHWRGYVYSDVWARYKKMRGFNVLHPMGFDAFGLPAENYAIKQKSHPEKFTYDNIQRYEEQLKQIGAMYDWDRKVITSDPEYYKWTQWIFLKLYEAGLAYRKKAEVNFCPSCETVLANEQVIGGATCERCSTEVTKKSLEQWFFKISDFAQRLIDDLEKVEWPERVKIMQKNWIGKSEGVEIEFGLEKSIKGAKGDVYPLPHPSSINVFTTRPDTLFGVTYLVLAPEHPLVAKLTTKEHQKEVSDFIDKAKRKTEVERLSTEKTKEGVFTGSSTIHPLTGLEIPIWISDYVLPSYGTGAVMAVPAHDTRDFLFAKKYDLPIMQVIAPAACAKEPKVADVEADLLSDKLDEAFEAPGILCNSEQFNGLTSEKAIPAIIKHLEENQVGKEKTYFKLRDWLISRQRYWGAPIPIIYCKKCGEVPVPESDLPVMLPEVKEFLPTGQSPLAMAKDFVETTCPTCKGKAERETDTMDTFVDSSWYYLRFCSPQETSVPFDKKAVKYWMPVDQYVGGVEHAILHLLYSRFITKVLFDQKEIEFDEPFMRLFTQGMIYYQGAKMSKSKGNVVSPDEIIEKFGTDTLRCYELFVGPPELDAEWSDSGIEGVNRFLKRAYDYISTIKTSDKTDPTVQKFTHQTIKKVTDDLERFHFNTIISTMMVFLHFLANNKDKADIGTIETFIKLLSPVAPHLAEELWSEFTQNDISVFESEWPKYDAALAKEENAQIVVQIDGKTRGTIQIPADSDQTDVEEVVKSDEKISKYLEKKVVDKVIFVPNRLINFVIFGE